MAKNPAKHTLKGKAYTHLVTCPVCHAEHKLRIVGVNVECQNCLSTFAKPSLDKLANLQAKPRK